MQMYNTDAQELGNDPKKVSVAEIRRQFFEARGIQDCQSVPVEKEWKQALSNYGVCEHELYPLDHIFTKWASGRLKGKIFSQCQGNFNWFQRLFLLKTSSLSWVASSRISPLSFCHAPRM